jgi:GTP-binding protein EngB required for normal cell division
MVSVALQSEDHRDLLDIIDKLRSQGINKYVDLPEIIVCGDQSAGKSSVLEAISGMSFPTKDNLCTRFATELVLRRGATARVNISINPGPERSAEERKRLLCFNPTGDIEKHGLGFVVESAKHVMGLSDTKAFSTDTLRVELCGPTQPHLTMVDLPGLFRAGNIDQSVESAKTVRKMVRSYMKRPRSIILAVVSAKSDFALQEVTELARELDPTGVRTLGLITKPDTLDIGSDSENGFLKLAQNKDVVFRLGWHVLKNRDYEMRDATSTQRDEAEEEFFSKGAWASMNPTNLGAQSLKPRLSNVLKDQILRQLPSLLQDIEGTILECEDRLQRLGTPRTTFSEQRRYLLRVSQDFSTLMKAAVDGIYKDTFFGSARTDEGYQKRLRAVVQNTLTEFEEDMRKNGQTRVIIDKSLFDDDNLDPNQISRSDYVGEVKDLMKRSRGCELSGTFNPLIIGELFSEQCRPWRDIADRLKKNILKNVYRTTEVIIGHVSVEGTLDAIFRVLCGGIEKLNGDLNEKVVELLDPHYTGHPVTYNHYLTDNVQKAQSDRQRHGIETIIKSIFGKQISEPNGSYLSHSADFAKLSTKLVHRTEADMEHYASSLAVDYMQAYYEVRQ